MIIFCNRIRDQPLIIALPMPENIPGAERMRLKIRRILLTNNNNYKKMKKKQINKLPMPSKTQYNTPCEAVHEYFENLDPLLRMAESYIDEQKLLDTYKAYSKSDQSAIGPHFHVFDSVDLGSDYTAHLGMMLPPSDITKVCIQIAITKEVRMADGCSYTLGIANVNDEIEPVFFTESFWVIYSSLTRFCKNMFFLDLAMHYKSIYSRWDTGEVRWLLSKGMAFGRRYCQFDVFHDFTDEIQYIDGVDEDDLEDDMWNEV